MNQDMLNWCREMFPHTRDWQEHGPFRYTARLVEGFDPGRPWVADDWLFVRTDPGITAYQCQTVTQEAVERIGVRDYIFDKLGRRLDAMLA